MNGLRKIVSLHLALGILFCGVAFSQQPPAPAPASDTQAPPVTGLVPDHAALSVADIEREAEWYERVLGFKVFSKADSNPDMRNWHLVIPGYRIDLIQYKGSKRPDRGDSVYLQQGWVHVVFHVDDVALALKQLDALHVQGEVNRLKDGTPYQILLHDPEGNEVEIRRNLVV